MLTTLLPEDNISLTFSLPLDRKVTPGLFLETLTVASALMTNVVALLFVLEIFNLLMTQSMPHLFSTLPPLVLTSPAITTVGVELELSLRLITPFVTLKQYLLGHPYLPMYLYVYYLIILPSSSLLGCLQRKENLPLNFLMFGLMILIFFYIVSSVWSNMYFGNPMSILTKKLKETKATLKVWSSAKHGKGDLLSSSFYANYY